MTAIQGGAGTGLRNATTWLFSIVKPSLLISKNGLEIPESGKIKFKKKKKPFQMSLGLGRMTPAENPFNLQNFELYISNKMGEIMKQVEEDKKNLTRWEDPTLREIEEILRRRFPHGHEGFIPMTIKEMDLHSKKNHDYAHGGKATGNFDRVGAIMALYPGIDISKSQNVAIVYLLKQLDAALWLESQGHSAVVQGQDERWEDVSVYAKIIRLLLGEIK